MTLRAKLIVVRKGRKRKPGPRYPNGELKEDKGIDPKIIAFRMPHRQDVPQDKCHDQRAENPLGRLCLNGFITEEEFEAGRKYRNIVLRYRSMILAPNASPPSIAGFSEPGRGLRSEDEDADGKTRNSYNEAFEALNAAGNLALRAVNHIAVHERTLSEPRMREALFVGLRALVRHYGLTNH